MTVFSTIPGLPASIPAVVSIPLLLGALLASYIVYGAFWRLYLSPISKFPGPKFAAMTFLYEMWYDIILDGQYMNRIIKMHEQYGPIVRINPQELHIAEATYYGPLFAPPADPKTGLAPKRHKWLRFVRQFGTGEKSTFGTTKHDMHRMRRHSLDPFFNPAAVKRVQGLIKEKVDKLCQRMQEMGKNGAPIPIRCGYACLTTDVISEIAMARSYNYLDKEKFFPEWSAGIEALARVGAVLKPFWWLVPVFDKMPLWCAKMIHPGLYFLLKMREDNIEKILEIANDEEYRKIKPSPTIFHELMTSSLPESDKTIDRLEREAQLVIGAGTEPTSTTLAVTTVYVLGNPEIQTKLQKELDEAIPDPLNLPPLQVLEKLPYLNAVIREGLRLGYPVNGRLQRIAETNMQFHDWVIPPGTPCSMSAPIVHNDPAVWKDPLRYDPERWMNPEDNARNLKHLVAFSKGPRMCLGVNLAYGQMYMAIAAVFRRFHMRLCEYTTDDLELVADWFVPKFKKDQKLIQVTLEGLRY